MNADSKDDQASAEAGRWFSRLLAPDCVPAERAAFERWRAARPDHAAAYARVERLMGRVAELRHDPAMSADIEDALRMEAAAPRRRLRRTAFALAAGVALAVGLGVFHFHRPSVSIQRYATAIGEQRALTLDDGTRLLLDTDTRVEVSYSASERRLMLASGRAQYDVAHEAQRPFVVEALGGTVTAHGTQFQTGIRDGAVTVVLLEGAVTVETDGAAGAHRQVLAPGERLDYNRTGTLWTRSAANLDSAGGWTHGKLVFKDVSLKELVEEVNRYSSVKFEIVDPALNDLRISGSFKANDQASLILALQGIWSIHADRSSTNEIRLSRGSLR